MKPIEIRVRRERTATKTSCWESLETWASRECRTIPAQLQIILENQVEYRRFLTFHKDQAHPGLETT